MNYENNQAATKTGWWTKSQTELFIDSHTDRQPNNSKNKHKGRQRERERTNLSEGNFRVCTIPRIDLISN